MTVKQKTDLDGLEIVWDIGRESGRVFSFCESRLQLRGGSGNECEIATQRIRETERETKLENKNS